jgi:hypothetical protein
VFVRSGGVWSQQAQLTVSDGATNDQFGWSVALYGSTAVLSAPGKNGFAGSAYVFVRSGGVWSQQAQLTASDGASGDEFGISVALYGSTAVVGATQKNSATGAAYVFTRSGGVWSQQAELTASDGASHDQFGASVAVYGSTTVVGAPQRNAAAGAAYVFTRSGGVWSQQTQLTASDAQDGEDFGWSVALYGTTAVVGAPESSSGLNGAAYVFLQSGSAWSQQAKLTASDGQGGDAFGSSVAIYGSTTLVGAWVNNSQTGAAYTYTRSGPGWSQQSKLTASDAAPGNAFGRSVALYGSTALIGAYGTNTHTGAAYTFANV